MDTVIAAPASCEVRVVICFLHAEGQSAVEIRRRLCRVYGDNVNIVIDDSVHVLSVFTPTLRGENV